MDSGTETRSGTGEKDLYKFKFSDLYKNPQTLANEMGESEDNTIISKGGITMNLAESEQRFEKGADGNYITKAYKEEKKLRADGTEKDDDPVSQKKEVAASTEETEETAEEATTPLSAVETTKADMLAKANTAQAAATATPATTAAAQNKKKGYKSGTVATTPQGISMDDDDSVRPLRGLLADQNKKKALIG